MHRVSNASVSSCWAVGTLEGEVEEGEEEHQCQHAGSVMHFVAAHRKHPSILLLIDMATWYSQEESSCKLSFLNAKRLLLVRRNHPHDDEQFFPNSCSAELHDLKANGRPNFISDSCRFRMPTEIDFCMCTAQKQVFS
jgi:hypothetical protein